MRIGFEKDDITEIDNIIHHRLCAKNVVLLRREMDFLLKQENLYLKAQKQRVLPGDESANTEQTEPKEERTPIQKEFIQIECQGELYFYCLGEVLNRQIHSAFLSAFKNGDEKYSSPITYQVHYCIFRVNMEGCTPFLEFLLIENTQKGGVLEYPQAHITLSKDAMNEHDLIPDELLSGMVEIGKQIGLFSESLNPTTEEINQTFHGFVEGEPREKISNWNWFMGRSVPIKDLFFFFPVPSEDWIPAKGKWAVLDEIFNKKRRLDVPIDPYVSSIFYQYPDLMTLYGPEVNPVTKEKDHLLKTLESAFSKKKQSKASIPVSNLEKEVEQKLEQKLEQKAGKKLREWNAYLSQYSQNMFPQEIPYCLYLCESKLEIMEEEEDDVKEAISEQEEEKQEEEPKKIKERFSSSKKKPGEKDESMIERCEGPYGYYYYFTSEPLENNKDVKRYAVFAYNTQYVLDENIEKIMKELQLEEFQDNQRETVDEANQIYDSIYYQQDDIPMWCIKHRECIVVLKDLEPKKTESEPADQLP